MQRSAVQCSTEQFGTPLHYTTTLHYTTLYYTILYYTILYYTTLHYTTLHDNTLITPHQTTLMLYVTLLYDVRTYLGGLQWSREKSNTVSVSSAATTAAEREEVVFEIVGVLLLDFDLFLFSLFFNNCSNLSTLRRN